MEAKYFYNKLITDDHGSKYGRNPYDGESILIHRVGEDRYFKICSNGVVQSSMRDDSVSTLDDLHGDNYELYNNIRLIKAGYVTVPDYEFAADMLEKISDWFEDNKCGNINITRTYGDFRKDYVEVWVGAVRLNILSIPALVQTNMQRKKMDLIQLPFRGGIKNNDALYIYTVDNVFENFQKVRQKVETSTKDLIRIIIKKELGLKSCKYLGCKIQRPIYY